MVYMYHSFLIHSSADAHLGCYLKLFKTTELYTVTVLEVRRSESVSLGQNQHVSRANILGAIRENLFFAFFHLWSCRHCLLCGYIEPVTRRVTSNLSLSASSSWGLPCVCVCVCEISLCFPLTRMHVVVFGTQLDNPG